jgi:outer membrane murein-binding lipoprotein Lpp
MEYGLTKLILIDSYLPGRVYEIELNGHTNILGGNAAGKTSLIKLIVMFYGESPFALGIKEISSSKQLGFTQRYLPRTGSYVIFEYLVKGELRTLIYTANLNHPDKYHRNFVPVSYQLEDFWDTNNQSPINSNLWRKQAKVRHAGKIKEVTTDIEHTEVLLGGKDHMYGMGPRQLDMRRMKKLMTSMFHKDAGHTELTKIIEDWINSDLHKKKEQLADGIIETSFLQTWVDEYHVLTWLKVNKEKFDKLVEYLMDYDDAYLKQQSYYLATDAKSKELEISKNKAFKAHKEKQSAINEKIQESQNEKASLEDEEEVLALKHRELVGEKEQLDVTLKSLRSKFPSNIEQRIEQSIQQESVLISRTEELSDITEKEKSTAERRQKQIDSIKHEFSLKESQLKQIISKNENDVLMQQANLRDKHVHELEQQLTPLSRELEHLLAKENQLAGLQIQLKTRLETPSLATDDKLRMVALKEKRDQLADKRDVISSEIEILEKALTKAKANKQIFFDELVASQKLQDEYFDELQALTPFINPHPDSFLAFLQHNSISWADTFGRALRPEVLQQKNLSPESTGEKPSIFGVSIDSSKLLQNHEIITDASDCQSRIDEINEQIETLATKISQLEKDFGKSESEIKAIEKEKVASVQKQKRNRGEIGDNDTSIHKEGQRLNTLLKDKISEWEKELSTASEQLNEVSEAKEDVKAKIEDIKSKSASELNAAFNQIKNQFDASNKELEQQLDDLPNARLEREAEIQKAYTTELESHGIDSEYVKTLESEIKNIKTFRATVKKEKGNYEAYQEYQADTYEPRYQTLINEIEEAKAKFEKCRATLIEVDNRKKQYEIQRESQAVAHHEKDAEYNSQITKLSQVLEHNVEISIDTKPAEHEALSTEDIEQRFFDANESRKQLNKKRLFAF